MTTPFQPLPCTSDGGGTTTGLDVEGSVLCDVLPDGTIAGTALVEAVYDEATGLRTGTRVVNPVTGAAYVPAGILQPCGGGVNTEDAVICYTAGGDPTPRQGFRRETISGAGLSVVEFLGDDGAVVVPDAWTPGPCPQTIFAGFVCDVFGGTPFIPATPPTCPGTALGAPLDFSVGDGMTEGPPGTFTPTSNATTTITWNRSPNDAQHGLCSVRFVNDPGTGDDPFWQLIGTFVDLNGNGQSLDPTWITAIETAMGIGELTDIPPGTTATAPVAGTSVTITFDGPSPHSQMYGGNGAFFIRNQDGDGLAAGVTLEFSPPIQSFTIFTNVVTPTPGSFSGVQEAQATPGTAAVAAAPAGVFEIKQFRAPDGTASYENLDGTAHPVLGTVGECGTFVHEQLCDSTGSVPFLRVYTITGGAVSDLQDYDLSGVPYAVVGDAGRCQTELASLRLVEHEVLCYTAADGVTITEFLRRYLMDQDGVTVITTIDTLLDGTTAFVAVVGGTITLCGATGRTPEALALCDIVQVPSLNGARAALNLTTLPVGPTAGAFPNGISYTVDQGFAGGSGTYLINANSTQNWTFGQPSMLRFGINNLNVGAECVTLPVGTVAESIHPNHSYNAGTRVLCNGGAALVTDESIFTLAAATTLAIASNPGGGGQRGLVRLEAGLTTFTQVLTPFLRTICRTCGAMPVITDTTMDGLTPYVPIGTVGVCSSDDSCTGTVLGEVCYTPPPAPSVFLTDDFAGSTDTGVSPGPITYTVPNFGGGVPSLVMVAQRSTGGHPGSPAGAQIGGVSTPAGTGRVTLDFGQPLVNASVELFAFDSTGGEQILNVSPPFQSVTGNGTAAAGNTTVNPTLPTPPAGTVVIHFGTTPVQNVSFDYKNTTVAGIGIRTITGSTVAAGGAVGHASVVQDCASGVIAYVDLATGATLAAGAFTVVDCSADDSSGAALAARLVNVVPGSPYTAGTLPGALTGMTVMSVTGNTTVVDAAGTPVAIPAGMSVSWSADDDGTLTGPQSVTADPAAGRAVITATVRP